MKIAHYIYSGSEKVHGGEISSINFISELSDIRDIDVFLYRPTEITNHLKNRGLDYNILRPDKGVIGPFRDLPQEDSLLLKVLHYLRFNRRVAKQFRQYDIIHYNNILGYYLTYPGTVIAGADRILHVRTEPRELTWYWIFALLTAARVVCVSEAVRHSLKRRLPYLIQERILSKMAVVYNGVRLERTEQCDKSSIEKIDIDPRRLSVGYVGSIDPRKNQLQVIKSMTEMDNLNVEIHFLGHPKDLDYYNKCLQYVNVHNLEDNCYFHGYQKNIDKWYAKLDVISLASKREGLPRAVLESMSHGTPVVSIATTGVREIINNEDNGFIVKSIPELLLKLKELEENQDRLTELGDKANTRIMENFTNEAVADELDSIYSELETNYSAGGDSLNN